MNTIEAMLPARNPMRHFWKVVLAVMVLAVFLKIPTLNLPHTEGDEIAFWHLANNWIKTGKYTDKGDDLTPYPAYGDRFTRDMPVHPPVFIALLLPFAKAQALDKAVIASWIGHLLAILAVALIGRHAFRNSSEVFSAFSPYFWLPLLGIATDPVMTWISGILWIDNLDAGFAAMAVAFALVASDSRRPAITWSIAGTMLGLGLLSKVTAAVIIPVLGYLIFLVPGRKERIAAGLYCVLPALLLSLPWYLPLYFTMGEFILPKMHLAPEVFKNAPCPFCDISSTRPAYYFFLKLLLISPLAWISFGFLGFAYSNRAQEVGETRKRSELLLPVVWFMVVIIAATLAGSFIMRRLASLLPAMYVMLYFLLVHFEATSLARYKPVLLFVSALAIVYSGIAGGFYLFNGNFAEFFSPLELAKIIDLWSPR